MPLKIYITFIGNAFTYFFFFLNGLPFAYYDNIHATVQIILTLINLTSKVEHFLLLMSHRIKVTITID